jgi:putative ABC transport system permease protein
LKRFKTSAVLNILGLSVAFAVFSITMIQCYYDFSYNRNFKNAKEIYQFSYFWKVSGEQLDGISVPLAQAITDRFPEVRACCLVKPLGESLFKTQANPATSFSFRMMAANEDFLAVFTPEILAGDAKTAFTEKNKVMLTADIAQILFGKENPVGQMIWQDTIPYTVVAVCESFPANCSLKNGIYTTNLDEFDYKKMSYSNYRGYFLLKEKDVAPLQQKLEQTKFDQDAELSRVEFIPVTEKYFRRDIHFHDEHIGNLATTLSFLAIGIVTMLVAFINFMNFSIAMIPSRVRGMNVQKILGANYRRLQYITVSEAPCFALLSFLIGLFLIVLFQNTQLNEFFPADLSLNKNIAILTFTALAGIVLSVLFGIYPARKVTSFQPAMALSGSFAQSKQSVALRNILTTLQFLAAIVLICMAIFIKIQHDYMTNYSWGFQKENIVYLRFMNPNDIIPAYENEIRQNPDILSCTISDVLPGSIVQNWGIELDNKKVGFAPWNVRNDFLRFFGIKVIEGRDFIPDDDGKVRVICNQAFMKKYEMDKIPKIPDSPQFEFVGLINDIHFESLHSEIRPLCFITALNWFSENHFYIKISGNNTMQSIDYLKETWKKLTDTPFDFHFLDAQLDSLYQSESNLATLISIFGLIAVIIAVMGVYGLIVFNAKYKAKEIAIRKVNGSTIKEIMLMLNKNLLLQLLIAFVMAVPISYFIVQKWLENFACKTPVYGWVFLLGGVIILLITLLTVSAQSYRAARANPTKALNSE